MSSANQTEIVDPVALFSGLTWTLLHQATVLPKEEDGVDLDRIAHRRRMVEADLRAAEALKSPEGITDDEFWRRAATKPFYAGKRASNIRGKEEYMLSVLGDAEELCHSEWDPGAGKRFREFLNDERCVRNSKSLERTVSCARRMQRIKRLNSGRSLIEYYVRPTDTMKTVHDRLSSHIDLGYVTTLHFMTDLGLPVVKPDRVVNRLAIRLGIIRSYDVRGRQHILSLAITAKEAEELGKKDNFNWPLQAAFERIAERTGHTMRSLDLILVKLGQQPDEQFGYARTICSDRPLCHLCKARPLCAYGSAARITS